MKKVYILICISFFSFTCVYSQHKIRPKNFEVPPVKKPVTKPTPPAKPDKGWRLTFSVTIVGNGIAAGFHEDDEFEFSINHRYSGTIDLTEPNPVVDPNWSEVEKKDAIASRRKIEWRGDLLKPAPNADIWIDDESTLLQKEKDEGDTFENTSVTIHTEVKDIIIMPSYSTILVFDKKSDTYNVTIALTCKSSIGECKEKKSTTIAIKRSDHGYGDLPTSETNTEDTTTSFEGIKFPTTKDLIAGSKIHHPVDMKLPEMIKGHYEYDSKDLEPDKPMYKNVPESKTKVKVHVFYSFSKL
jgi:hypothetical protein